MFPKGDTPQKAQDFYEYLQGHHETEHRVATWTVDWMSLAWMWGFVFVLVRYNPDGKRDPTFGSGGLVFTDVGVRDSIGAIVLQRDGRLVALGSRTLARYLGSWCRGWR